MAEVEITGQQYLIGKLNARQQLQVVKRLAPILQGLLPIWAMIQQQDGTGSVNPSELGMHAAVVISNTISALSDQDTNFILDMCLSTVKFRSPAGNWAPLLAANGSGLVMLDAAEDLATQMRLLWEVLHENLRNFSLDVLLPTSLQQSWTNQSLLSN